MEKVLANDPADTGDEPNVSARALSALTWTLFWHMICAHAAPLFLIAATVCFFAYNWAAMPAFAKFGLIGLLMLGTAVLAFWRGFLSLAGGLALLACGLWAGPLLAVFGQVYQTGANAWELFRAWSLFLLPLALAGRQNGLWIALWLTGSFWAGLYLHELTFARMEEEVRYLLYLALIQAAALALREGAAFFLTGPDRSFLRARWVPRLMAFPLVSLLTCSTALYLLFPNEKYFSAYGPVFLALLLLLLLSGAVYYGRKKHDTVMIAYGLMSLITLVSTLPLLNINDQHRDWFGVTFLVALLLLVGSGVAVLILKNYHQRIIPPAPPPGEDSDKEALSASGAPPLTPPGGATQDFVRLRCAQDERPPGPPDSPGLPGEESPPDAASRQTGALPGALRTPWVARLLAGLCAWIAVPFFLAAGGLLLGIHLSLGGNCLLLVLVMAIGAGISRPEGGIFARQATLCLALTGTLGAGVLIAELSFRDLPWLPMLALLSIGYPAVNNGLYRFFAVTFGIPLLALLILDPDGGFLFHGFHQDSLWFHDAFSLPGQAIPALFFTLLCLAIAHLYSSPAAVEDKPGEGYWRPFFLGSLAALLLMGAESLSGLSPIFRMLGPCSGLGLMYFSFRLSAQLDLPPVNRVALAVLCAAVAAVSLRLPWFGPGLFALALARYRASLPFVGCSILYLAVCVNLEYYQLGSSLLHKSASLAAVGLILLAAALILHALLRTAIRKGRLPDPDLRFPGQRFPGLLNPGRIEANPGESIASGTPPEASAASETPPEASAAPRAVSAASAASEPPRVASAASEPPPEASAASETPPEASAAPGAVSAASAASETVPEKSAAPETPPKKSAASGASGASAASEAVSGASVASGAVSKKSIVSEAGPEKSVAPRAVSEKSAVSGAVSSLADGRKIAPRFSRSRRNGIVAVCLLSFFCLFSWSVLQKERLLANGDRLVLALRPLDPRSLMQGDYMRLRFAVEDEILNALRAASPVAGSNDPDFVPATAGPLIGTVMEQGQDTVFHFKRLDDGSPLAAGEKRLLVRILGQGSPFLQDRRIQVGAGAFFFQEGHGPAYDKAKFALLRVDASGNCLITGLLDGEHTVIQPGNNPEE